MKKHYKRKFKLKTLSTYGILLIFIAIIFSLSVGYSLWGSTLKINSKITLQSKERTLYFEAPSDWASTNILCYMWGTDSNGTLHINNDWPGAAMTKVEGTTNVYSYTISTDDPNYDIYSGVIFCTAETVILKTGSTSTHEFQKNSTIDLSFSQENFNQIFKIVPYSDPSNPNNIRVFCISYFVADATIDRNAYAWDPVANPNWPGVPMTKVADNVYSYIVDRSQYSKIIFNCNGSQTSDLTVPTIQDQCIVGYSGTTDSEWGSFYSFGAWYAYK